MSGPFVTVERNTDGEVFIGELVRAGDSVWAIYSGVRGRPVFIAEDDIADIQAVSSHNRLVTRQSRSS